MSETSRANAPRFLVLSDGYHGIHESFISLTPPCHGVPLDIGILPLEGNEDLIQIAAAVIVEPVIVDYSEERRKYIQSLREKCNASGALLIFDEVITGLRFKGYSVANLWGITPDLICLGKSLANGLPLSLVGGTYEVMNAKPYFVSSTFAGETLSLIGAKAVVTALKKKKFDIDRLWAAGENWIRKFNELGEGLIQLKAYPTRGAFVGEPIVKALFFQECCRSGVLFGPSWFYNWPLIDHDDFVFGVVSDVIGRIRRGEVTLHGEMPESPFAMKVRKL